MGASAPTHKETMRILKKKKHVARMQPRYPVGSIIKCAKNNLYMQCEDGSLQRIVSAYNISGNINVVLRSGTVMTLVNNDKA